MKQLASSNWKERLEAVDEMTKVTASFHTRGQRCLCQNSNIEDVFVVTELSIVLKTPSLKPKIIRMPAQDS